MADSVLCIILIIWVSSATLNAASTTCPSACTCTESYGELTVSCAGQGLREIPSNIPTAVIWLNLKYNNITSVTTNSFNGLHNLHRVDVSNNNIEYISTSAFKQLLHLQNVDISGNQLATLSEEVFNVSIVSAKQEQRSFFVYMGNNPWNCDCRLTWLAWMLRDQCPHYSSRLMTCKRPDSLQRSDIIKVPLEEFVCQSDVYTNIPTATTIVSSISSTNASLNEHGSSWANKWSFLSVVGIVFVAVVMMLAILVLKITKKINVASSSDTEPIIMSYIA